LRNLIGLQSEAVREAGAKVMGNIHQFTARQTQTQGTPSAASADVIIFPGVRVERGDQCGGDRIIAGKAGNRAAAREAAYKED
jgi:hypothetical protein